MKTLSLMAAAVMLAACTQAGAPAPESALAENKLQGTTTQSAAAAVATTPILSLLVGTSVTPNAKGMWCLKDGTPPFTRISVQDESIAAPIENKSAPLPGGTVAKDTAVQQAPGTAAITSQSGDSTFKIQWQSEGIKGDAQIMIQGDSLSFTDESGTASFARCD